jgi:hypothetical protein
VWLEKKVGEGIYNAALRKRIAVSVLAALLSGTGVSVATAVVAARIGHLRVAATPELTAREGASLLYALDRDEDRCLQVRS